MRRATFVLVLIGSGGCLALQGPPEGGGGGGGGGLFSDDDPSLPAGGFVEVAASYSRVYALHEDGSLWSGSGRIDDETYLALGGADVDGACAVRGDGDVVCGLGSSDSFTLPGPFVDVSGGKQAGCALRADGDARCWPDGASISGPFAAVGSGDRFACGVRDSSGELTCWGIDEPTFDEIFTDIPGGRHREVTTADHVGCALSSGGAVHCWGYDFYELIAGAPSGSYDSVWMDDSRACATADDGPAVCWGEDAGDPNHPELDPPDTPLSALALGDDFGCGITAADGTLTCWE